MEKEIGKEIDATEAIEVKSLGELRNEAQRFIDQISEVQESEVGRAATLPTATVVALNGNLGSGKTTFTQTCARILGIEENLTSPTFVIFKKYLFNYQKLSPLKNLIHIDAYRIDDPHELEVLGFKELLADPDNLIFIEWPERVDRLLPDDIINLQFEFVDENTRKITFPI